MHTLIDLFQTFQNRGNKTAFVYRTGIRRFTFSYQWLHDRSLEMASWLEQQGVEKGDRVVIWAPNSPWWGVAFWGCIVRGAIVVPVDFMSGRDRAEKIIQLTDAKVVLQSQYKIDKLTEDSGSRKLENIENLEYALLGLQATSYKLQANASDTAELIYTSGTTGDPKGVILTHKNLISNMEQINQHVPVVNEKWNFLSVLPLSHTFEQMAGFLTPLYRGGTIVYMRTLKPSAIMEALAEEDIYAFPIVPRLLQALKMSIEKELARKHLSGVFHKLLTWQLTKHSHNIVRRAKWFPPIHRMFGKHFQFFISGGAALPKDTAEFWMGMGFRVIEGYGITECSPVLTANTFETQIIGSTGKPLPGVEIKINAKNTPPYSSPSKGEDRTVMSPPYEGGDVRGGFEGEILAKGPNVFPGYYQNEEATKKTFTNDGFFKTGDNGYFDAQGNLYIKGRQKEMIVTGAGINVYPDDIEPVLLSIPGVKDACVIGKNTQEGEEVHAVLILSNELPPLTPPSKGGDNGVSSPYEGEDARRGFEQRAKSIIDTANSKLDTLQQITGFTLWPEKEFPKTSTMKVQKFKVKQQIEEFHSHLQTFTPSNTDKLIEIIATVTGKPSSEITEQSILVSDLGLTSIARLELVNTLEQEFRLDMEDTAITQTTSVAELRKMIEKREKTKKKKMFHWWIDSTIIRLVRRIYDNLVHIPLLSFFVNLEKKGIENLNSISSPVIFIANHVSYFDPFIVYRALPAKFRYTTASASWEGLYFYKDASFVQRLIGKLMYEYVAIFSMNFIVAEQQAFRGSLIHMGKLIDRKRNILIFPEGERSWDGTMRSFQPGLGIMVKELRIPIIPIKLKGLFELFPRTASLPKRGKASITFGKPLAFTNESTAEILEKTKEAIEKL